MDFQRYLQQLFIHRNITIIFFLLLTISIFFPALFNGFIWDDAAIYDNPVIKSVHGLGDIWFHPVTNTHELHYWPIVYTTFWIEYRLWGDNPAGYHLINILLHTMNVVLLWLILRKIGVGGAGLCAILFAVHPVHVESVAWAIERKDVLSVFFYLTAFLCYLAYHDNRSWVKYSLSLIFFISALLSKSIAITLPIAILLYLWWKNGKISKPDFMSIIPFFILACTIAYCDVRFVHQRVALTSFTLNPLQRIYVAGKSLWFYLGKLIFPFNLITVYPRWNLAVSLFSQYFYPLTFLAFLGILILGKKYFGRGAFAALAFFVITLSPTLGFINFSVMYFTFVTDRFQYLASIGPLILAGTIGYKCYTSVTQFWKPLLRIGGVTVIAFLSFLTWKQTDHYKNDETLFRYTILKNPNAWLAYNNLGVTLMANRKYTEAEQCYRQALILNPEFVYIYNNYGLLLVEQNRLQEAVNYFQIAIKYSPSFTKAYDNLGVALAMQGKMNEALLCFKKALMLNPYDPDAKYNLDKATRELNQNHVKNSPTN
ncbi:MAG: tetratricopeptide repeat protein [bacterium]